MPNQSPQLLDSPFDSYEARKESRKSLLGFSLVYLTGYFTDPPASFHRELLAALEDENERRALILGFRGSGKSTFGSLALPLWAALEYPDKYPFIILIADSSRQATLNISAIKHELETNQLIKQDYGEIKGNVIEDFALKGEGEEWQKQNIVLSNGVRILARSRGQKVRGLRHLQHRPKLVVIDDPEDGEWVRTKENRDKTDLWLHSEIIPGMDARKGKLIVIGNLLQGFWKTALMLPMLSDRRRGFSGRLRCHGAMLHSVMTSRRMYPNEVVNSAAQPTPDEVYRRIEDFKRRPAQIEQTPELFHYDPHEPLHIPEKAVREKPVNSAPASCYSNG